MRYKAVIGLGCGDEGKGVVVDWLVRTMPESLVVRFSGGHQAGHTVESEISGYRHVFANFGSGTLQKVPTYWSKKCTVEPVGLLKEYDLLTDNGFSPRLFIDAECPITTPYDIMANRLDHKYIKNGTCGVGFGNTVNRENKFYHLQFQDLWFPNILKERLERIKEFYGLDTRVGKFIESCEMLTANASVNVVHGVPGYGNYVYEGSQGLLLDQNIGFYPNVTWANTGTKNLPKKRNFDFFLVTRAYQTRHGNGYMSNESSDHVKDDPLETNVSHQYQGSFRKGILDVDMLVYAIKKDARLRYGKERRFLCITCLDHLKEYKVIQGNEVKVLRDEDRFIEFIAHCLERADLACYNVVRFRRQEDGKICADY